MGCPVPPGWWRTATQPPPNGHDGSTNVKEVGWPRSSTPAMAQCRAEVESTALEAHWPRRITAELPSFVHNQCASTRQSKANAAGGNFSMLRP